MAAVIQLSKPTVASEQAAELPGANYRDINREPILLLMFQFVSVVMLPWLRVVKAG